MSKGIAPANKKLTDPVMEAIRVDREEHGMATVDIASKYDLSVQTASIAVRGMDSSRVQRKNRKVTPEIRERIRVDREEHGATITQLVAKYGIGKSTMYTVIKDMDASNVKRATPSRRVVESVEAGERPDLSKTDLGEVARRIAVARLLQAGYDPFTPLRESTPVDLLVLVEGKPLKCQCKHMFPHPTGVHILPLTTLQVVNPGGSWSGKRYSEKRKRRRYREDEVDYFIGYCQDNDSLYVVPREVAGDRSELRVWVLREPASKCRIFDAESYRNAFHLLRP